MSDDSNVSEKGSTIVEDLTSKSTFQKVLMAAAPALLVAIVGHSFVLWNTSKIMEVKLESMEKHMTIMSGQLKEIEQRSRSRWTREDHQAYESRQVIKFEKLNERIRSLELKSVK